MKKFRTIRLIVLVVGILFLTHSSLFASLRFERYSNKEGFNQNSVKAIEQDKYGFLWFGTPNGLIKYDGYNFYSYTYDSENGSSISNNNIENLFRDNKGNLWIGSWGGADVYIPQLENFFKVPLPSDIVVSNIIAGPDGRIWISGKDKLFVCELNYSGNEVSFKVSDNLLRSLNNISKILEFCFTSNNNILLSQLDGLLLLVINSDSVDHFPAITTSKSISSSVFPRITSIYPRGSDYWIGTDKGLYQAILVDDQVHIMKKFKLNTWDNRDVTDLGVLSIYEDSYGNIWIGTIEEGIFRYNTEEHNFVNYGYSEKDNLGISSSRINCFFQDDFGVIWIGTAQGGLNKLDLNQKPFIGNTKYYNDEQSISGNLINAILEDKSGKLWVSSYRTALCRSTVPVNDINVNRLRFERMENGIPFEKNENILSMYEDDKGFIWFLGFSGCAVFNPINKQFKKITLTVDGEQLLFGQGRGIYQLDQNNFLLGYSGIYIVRNPWSTIQYNNLPINMDADLKSIGLVNDILKDKKGYLWIGSSTGLYKCSYNENNFNLIRHYTTETNNDIKISNNNVFSLHEDPDGNIWIGTFGGGLNKILINNEGNPYKIEYFSKNELFPDDAVYGILQEDNEHLWISTDKGLCRLNTGNSNVDLFDVRDGIAHNNFRQNAYYKGNSGFFYFGGLNGLTIFKPKDIEINDVLSKSIITGISVNNNRVKIGEKVSGKVLLPESVFETKRIAINHRVKVISFHVAAQQSSTPLKNKVAHKLEGFDDDWIINERGKYTITYTSLPPGEYNLQVKSANSDGIWNNEITDLEINVLPPWYKTWWSYTIFMLIVIGASIVVFLYLIRLEKLKQRLIFEQIDKKRIDSVNEGKLRFFTSISHELRTPLTLIAGPLEKIIDRNKDEINKKYLFSIQNNAKRLLSLVDQLITFRQAEKGHLNVNIVSDTLGKFIYPITEVFEDYAIQQNINFFYKINSPNEKVFVDPEKTERIIYNLLSNSFKYTPPHGNISIETDLIPKDGKKMISIKVVDSGKGIPADKLEKIFEYFYQIEGREENVGGAGIGLAFCKSLIELMGGSITVESEPNKRTCFFVLMPSLEDLVTDNMKLLSSGKSFIKDWIPKPITDEYGQTEKIDKEPGKYSLLIVEDDLDVREFLKSELKEEYKLVLAKDGLDGLNKIRQNIPDLVISDVMMPEMNGFELCKKIKSDVETFHIPVILLTALGDSNSAVKGLEFGADDYISKPFSPKYLEIRIKKLIENNKRIKEYFSKHSNIPDKTIEMSNRDKEFLNQVVEAIEKNLADSSFGVEELATEIQYSTSQLYRRLKKITGQVPNVYLRNFRLQHAAELLKSKEGYTVAEVMYQIGIESKSYFATSFKKLFGKSPSEFAK